MRIDKFKMSNLANGLMIQHDERTPQTAEKRNYSNEMIDKTKTHLNYGLLDQNRGLSYLKEQLNSIYHIQRDDIVVAASCCVFLPKDFDGNEREFFTKTKEFLDSEFGERFCISANVHYDESTPHLHYLFIPAVRNEKYQTKGASKDYEYRLNAKKLLNREYFKTLHQRAERYLREQMPGKTINLLTGALHDRDYLKMDMYKAQQERERVSRLEKSNAERERLAQAKSAELDTQERTNRQRAAIRASEPAEPAIDPNLFAKKGVFVKRTDPNYIKTSVYNKAVKDKNEALIQRNEAQTTLDGKNYLLEQSKQQKAEYIEQIRELEQQVERLEKEAKQSKILYDKVLEVLPAVIKNNLRCSPERAEKIAQTVRENAKARAKRQKNKEITKQYSQDRQKEHNQRTGLQEQINQAQQQRQAQQPRKRENHQFNSPSR